MKKQFEYKLEVPLFGPEASEIGEHMQSIVQGIVNGQDQARERFARLDALINGGTLREVGVAFGEKIYARFPSGDPDMADYLSKRLSSMMRMFIASEPEEIVIGGKRYTVVLKEDVK